MKKALVLLGHGSRNGNEEFIELVAHIQKTCSEFSFVSYGFLEHAAPDIPTAITDVVKAGATRIYAVPILLFHAGHMKVDFPEELKKAAASCKNAKIFFADHIGVDKRIIHVVLDRIAEVSPRLSKNDAVLLVGRGSTDKTAHVEAMAVAALLREELSQGDKAERIVEFSFLGLASPDIKTGIANCFEKGAKTVVVIPYFLFDGILLKRIEKQVTAYGKTSQLKLGHHIGADSRLVEVILDRTESLY